MPVRNHNEEGKKFVGKHSNEGGKYFALPIPF